MQIFMKNSLKENLINYVKYCIIKVNMSNILVFEGTFIKLKEEFQNEERSNIGAKGQMCNGYFEGNGG